MLHYELAKARQADLLREAAAIHAGTDPASRSGRKLFALAQGALARFQATMAHLRETKPVRRRALALLGQR